MTTVEYTNRGSIHELSVNGHAGYAEPGSDIVCAGVSAITYALIGFLNANEGETRELVTDVRNGAVTISCEGTERIRAAFEMAMIGYEQIAAMYQGYVLVNKAADGG